MGEMAHGAPVNESRETRYATITDSVGPITPLPGATARPLFGERPFRSPGPAVETGMGAARGTLWWRDESLRAAPCHTHRTRRPQTPAAITGALPHRTALPCRACAGAAAPRVSFPRRRRPACGRPPASAGCDVARVTTHWTPQPEGANDTSRQGGDTDDKNDREETLYVIAWPRSFVGLRHNGPQRCGLPAPASSMTPLRYGVSPWLAGRGYNRRRTGV